MTLREHVAVVTGAGRGIGYAIAQVLAGQGAAVVLGYNRSAQSAEHLAAAIEKAGGQAVAVEADITDPAACETLVGRAVQAFGRLDILVNNAGTALEKLLVDTSALEWDDLMAVHLRGMFACSKVALPFMMKRRYGRIITISSIWGLSGAAGEVAYSAAKAGQIGFTKALAQEVGPFGITVNAVAPGAIATDMMKELAGPELAHWLDRTPVGRMGTPEEVADIVAFLARPESGFITGQIWSPNGGVIT